MDASTWITLALTLKVAAWATAINLVLGVTAGWLLARRRFPGREFVGAVLTLPLVLPPTVIGYYLLVVIGKRGWLGQWLHERRDIHADYHRCIGGPARSIVRVWLIANSLFQRGHGRCEYSGIEFEQPDGHRLKVL